MTVLLWLAGGAVFVVAFIWGLCRAAGGDVLAAPTFDDPTDLADIRLAEVVRLPCERRSRGETRNGIGGAA